MLRQSVEEGVARDARGACNLRGRSRSRASRQIAGIWHHRLTELDAPAGFAVFMALTQHNDDDEFRDVFSAWKAVGIYSPGGERHGR